MAPERPTDDGNQHLRSAEINTPNNSSEKARSFARDVLVNVLANLLAAAVIYLVGALVGLFPRSPSAILVAAFFVLFAISIFVYVGHTLIYRFIKRRSPDWALLAWCVIAFNMTSFFVPFLPWGHLDTADYLQYKIGYPVFGAISMFIPVSIIVQSYRKKKRHRTRDGDANDS